MAEEKTRVDFNAPASLVQRADAVADLLGTSRTSLLVDALRDELDELGDDEEFRRRLADAYYADRVDFAMVESILGTEEATRMRLLRTALDRDPPEPRIENDHPTRDEFYADAPPEWTPDDQSDEDDPGTRT